MFWYRSLYLFLGIMAINVDSNVLHSFENLSSRVQIWNIDLPKHALDIDEDSKNFDVLSELVRNRYLKSLRQTLLNNLDVTTDYKNNHLYQIQNCIDTCMVEMEKQALRQCMIASIYRESMSNLVCFSVLFTINLKHKLLCLSC